MVSEGLLDKVEERVIDIIKSNPDQELDIIVRTVLFEYGDFNIDADTIKRIIRDLEKLDKVIIKRYVAWKN